MTNHRQTVSEWHSAVGIAVHAVHEDSIYADIYMIVHKMVFLFPLKLIVSM